MFWLCWMLVMVVRCCVCRSVTLVGERGRKVLREVMKQSRNGCPVKSRQIPPEVVSKYRDKIRSLEGELKTILRQEEEEKQVRRDHHWYQYLELFMFHCSITTVAVCTILIATAFAQKLCKIGFRYPNPDIAHLQLSSDASVYMCSYKYVRV